MWANRVRLIADPTVRDLLALTRKPEVISLAGGVPANEGLAEKKIREILKSNVDWVVQYGEAGGRRELRQLIAEWLSDKWQVEVRASQVLITAGSQQALDLVARALINKGDRLGIEDPTYFVALYAFGAYEPKYVALGEKVEEWPEVEMVYLVPSFQNPTGKVMGRTKREKIAEWLRDRGSWLIEDDPYSELYFEEEPPLPIWSLIPEKVIYVGSFSKILAPGLRLGYLVATEEVVEVLERVKTGMDLCVNGLSQQLVEECLKDRGWWQAQLAKVREIYRRRAGWMELGLGQWLDGVAKWEKVRGGMFYWIWVPRVKTKPMLKDSVDLGVAYVPGEVFSPFGQQQEWLRLSFATVDKEMMIEGLRRLRRVIERRRQK